MASVHSLFGVGKSRRCVVCMAKPLILQAQMLSFENHATAVFSDCSTRPSSQKGLSTGNKDREVACVWEGVRQWDAGRRWRHKTPASLSHQLVSRWAGAPGLGASLQHEGVRCQVRGEGSEGVWMKNAFDVAEIWARTLKGYVRGCKSTGFWNVL